MKRGAITDEWICSQINLLWKKCSFQPKDGPFLLDPAEFYAIRDYKEQVRFLIRRYDLPYSNLNIFLHAALKSGNKRCAGLAQHPAFFDTIKLNLLEGQNVVTIEPDGTCTILDMSDSSNPRILKLQKAVPLAYATPAIYLEQGYINSTEAMGAIIAHEVAHVYLYYHGLQPIHFGRDEHDLSKEYLTDVATFVMGLGLLRLGTPRFFHAKYVRDIFSWMMGGKTEGTLGYLSLREMEYAQAQVLKRFQAG